MPWLPYRWHCLPLTSTLLSLLWLLPASTQAQSPDSAPTPARRVVSLSLCLDELVLELVERGQIAAVSALAADPRYSRHWQAAQQLPRHQGLAEQIVALQPDLILAAEYEYGKASQMLQQLGYTVHRYASPTTLADVPTLVRAVARQLGAEARAEKLLQQFAADLQQAKRQNADKPALLALSLAPNGYTPGRRNIKNEVLQLAGYRTVADALDLPMDSELSLEQLVALAPARIFLEEQTGNQDALAHLLLQHPAMRANTASQLVPIRSADWLCPGLGLGAAARSLAEAH